jgi:DNA replication protein DnaC
MTTLPEKLAAIGLRFTAQNLDDIVALATKKRWGPTEILEHVTAEEDKERARRSLERRLGRSRLGRFKPMSDFDWSWPTSIDRPAIESALKLEFMKDGPRNFVIIANQGLGKTTIAQNIGHEAVLAGHSVLFTTAAQLLLDLSSQDSARGLDRRLKHYARPGLLVVDEVGYLSYDNRNADLFFQVVSQRYEKKSLVLTTNLPFSEWPTIFPNAACATALIDRVVHHSEITALEGESYRRRSAEKAKKSRREKAA